MLKRLREPNIPERLIVPLPLKPFEQSYTAYGNWRGIRSRHTKDIRLLFFGLMVIALVFITLQTSVQFDLLPGEAEFFSSASTVDNMFSLQSVMLFSIGGAFAGFITVYEIGKRRFATVDLISMEILTITRLIATTSFIEMLVSLYEDELETKEVKLAEATSGFMKNEAYTDLFHANIREIGALNSDVVDYTTAFYTFLKGVREERNELFEYIKGTSEPDMDVIREYIILIMYLIDTLMSCAYRAIDGLVEDHKHRREAWRMTLVTAALANNFLYDHIEETHPMYRLMIERRIEFGAAINRLNRQK